jgi:glycosyltransferase involved in cell wall biosynthesis
MKTSMTLRKPAREGLGILTDKKVAIVHDWLVTYGGAERVLEQMLHVLPHADLYSLYDFIPSTARHFIHNKPVTTSFLQKFPFAKRKYRSYLPFMPLAIEQFDLSEYDVVISSSYAVAKGVITRPDQIHICMCYSPIRYAWDLMHQYLGETGLDKGMTGWIAKVILHRIRNWDYRTSNGVDEFIAISDYIARRIHKVYRRSSTVIYPPVYTDEFKLHSLKDNFYVTASRMVPYKKIGLIVRAFNNMPNKKLVVIGDGPEYKNIAKIAGSNIVMKGYQNSSAMIRYMQRARAFVFAAEEDFGIVPLEAQACGTPVIAFEKGGALETVIDGLTGIHFTDQTEQSIVDAVNRFERHINDFEPEIIRDFALTFSHNRFRKEFAEFVTSRTEAFFQTRNKQVQRRFDALSLIKTESHSDRPDAIPAQSRIMEAADAS